jgi:aspartate/methionine/tyrosine aminotransferase
VSHHPHLLVISDEIYEHIVFDGRVTSFASLPSMRERTITVNGFSKAFAMTGWRLGYAAAPALIAQAMAKVQSTFTAGANAFVQHAAIAALEGGRDDTIRMRETYRKRRGIVMERLCRIAGLKVIEPAGTFYAFPDVSAVLKRKSSLANVEQLCDMLLDQHGVAVVPGTAFGDEKCLRISFAANEVDLEKGLDRLAEGLA